MENYCKPIFIINKMSYLKNNFAIPGNEHPFLFSAKIYGINRLWLIILDTEIIPMKMSNTVLSSSYTKSKRLLVLDVYIWLISMYINESILGLGEIFCINSIFHYFYCWHSFAHLHPALSPPSFWPSSHCCPRKIVF